MSDPVEYRVGLSSRAWHLYDVEARFPTSGRASLELRLPVWTPGSYLVREYERHLQDLTCADEHGRPLAVRKLAKSRWVVECDRAASVRVRYRVYAHEVTVRTSHLDETHAYWNGATLFLYVDELRGAPVRVEVEHLPAGWRIATALAADPDHPHVLRAPDHDTLVDSPVEIGAHERIEFVAAGRPHTIAMWGRAPALDLMGRDKLVADLSAIIEAQAALFGGGAALPYDRYTFILHLVPGGYGGLEHKHSCTVLSSPHAFAKRESYRDLLELLSHEFFHLWNGKRIRPAALGPFDYQQECHTRSLWVVEGWTSYYDRYFLRRAGRVDADAYLEKIAEDIGKLVRIPGRFHQSLEESSWDAWIKLYRPDENTVNTTVSYYLKGGVVALLLDLEIRSRSRGKRSLDDALRALWHDFQATGTGYGDDQLQGIVEAATGCALGDFFDHAVRGRGELDLDGPLATVGLRLKRTADTDDQDREGGWLGANVKSEGGRLKVTESLEGGPAQLGNVYPGDEIVALDGWRVDEGGLGDRLRAARPGDGVRITLFRRDELREAQVTLGRRPHDQVEIERVKHASDEAKQAYAAWLGEPWKQGE